MSDVPRVSDDGGGSKSSVSVGRAIFKGGDGGDEDAIADATGDSGDCGDAAMSAMTPLGLRLIPNGYGQCCIGRTA